MPILITSLSFDSELFGYSVGSLQLGEKVLDWKEFFDHAKPFKMVYLISQKPVKNYPSSVLPVDVKITLAKKVFATNPVSEIARYSGKINERLESLALQSGLFSRFKTDQRLKRGEFEKLYSQWIKQSIESNKILVHFKEDEINGMITFDLDAIIPKIELLAVNQDKRGMGIAKMLLQSLEFELKTKGFEIIQVQTQEVNLEALRFYLKNGFRIVDRTYIYHFVKE